MFNSGNVTQIGCSPTECGVDPNATYCDGNYSATFWMIVNDITEEIFNNVTCRISYTTMSPRAYLFVDRKCNKIEMITGAEKDRTKASTSAAACTIICMFSDSNFYVVFLILATSMPMALI